MALIVLYGKLAWNARGKLLQGNSDFVAYYTALQIMTDGKGSDLYSRRTQFAYQQRVLDRLQSSLMLEDRFRAGLLFFVNPPITLIWFLPLANLSYFQAFIVWDLANFVCFAVGLVTLLRSDGDSPLRDVGFLTLACLAFPPVFVTLLQGQISGVLFFVAARVYLSLKKKRGLEAGLWLSLLLTKFQLLPAFLFLFLWKRQWRIVGGFLMGCLVALLVALRLVGGQGLMGYARFAGEMAGWVNRYGMTPNAMHCLRGQFNAWWYETSPLLALISTVLLAVALMVIMIAKCRRPDYDFRLGYALLIVTSILVSPHVNFHDLSLLLIPGVLVYQVTRERGWHERTERSAGGTALGKGGGSGFQNAIYGNLPLISFLTGYPLLWLSLVVSSLLPVQLSVWALLAWALVLARTVARTPPVKGAK